MSLASFGVPPVLVPSAWIEHTPFALWLITALRPRVFVELGTHYGQSYFTFCQAVEASGGTTRCYAVDTWQGDEHAGQYSEAVWLQVSATNNERYPAFSTLVRKTFDDALCLFADGSVDLLHIDGRHFYDDVLHDFTNWLPKLSDRGVVLLHDTNAHHSDFGVARLWRELEGQYPNFSFIHGHGLGVLAVGSNVPANVRQLTDLRIDSEEAAAVRGAYTRLGTAVLDRYSLRDQQKVVGNLRSELDALQRALGVERANAEQLVAALDDSHRQVAASAEQLAAAREEARQQFEKARLQITAAYDRAAEQTELARSSDSTCAALRQRVAELETAFELSSQTISTTRADVTAGSNQISDLRSQLENALAFQAALVASTSWRITRPIRAVKRALANPARLFKRDVVSQQVQPPPATTVTEVAVAALSVPSRIEQATTIRAADAFRARFAHLQPPSVFRTPGRQHRVTMVTDSISEGNLFGGVGTALILASAIARHTNAILRVVTRSEPPDASNYATFMAVHGLAPPGDVEFAFNPIDGSRELEVSDTDLFLTTSWWTTSSFRKVVDPARIIYLLQEDERMFYANSDERLFCHETLADESIRFVVNSKMLFDHLSEGPDALPNMKAGGVWFEPAFPAIGNLQSTSPVRSAKRRFFFYARPSNLRNLYWHGLEAIIESIEEGILDPNEWDFHFAGRDLSRLELPRGVQPILHQKLPWAEYVALTRTIDVGLSLMATPHPSYPPLDLTVAGAVVVTNKYGSKVSLDRYSDAIICVDPTVPALKQGIAAAVKRVTDRNAPAPHDHIQRDWTVAFKPVLERFFQPAHQE